MVVFGALGIFYMIPYLVDGKFFLIFSPIFTILFGLIMIGSEFGVGVVLEYFSFMRSLMGKGIFCI